MAGGAFFFIGKRQKRQNKKPSYWRAFTQYLLVFYLLRAAIGDDAFSPVFVLKAKESDKSGPGYDGGGSDKGPAGRLVVIDHKAAGGKNAASDKERKGNIKGADRLPEFCLFSFFNSFFFFCAQFSHEMPAL